ncbi:MAG TPA: carboxypeptidase-like regulatory domain-containing protein [Blastocatellia bacterium]|nr:carboxypeptidase-like regulatory domain-containing protein [Blastocatellia bacterium]
MFSLPRTAGLAATMIIALAATVPAHAPLQASKTKESTGSISGRVTIGDVGARGVTVLLVSAENAPIERPVAKSTSDQDGRFQIKGVPAGSYFLQAFAPALIAASDNVFGRQGKTVNLIEGEAVDGADIALRTGGVITGRVTDAEGQPLIQENVRLFSVLEQGRKQAIYLQNNLPSNSMFSTDDRGVYRLFGVPPGRYIVSVGVDTNGPNARINAGNTYYPLTYHPDVTEEGKATVIELASGSEATGVDIVLGRPSTGYSVSGRIVDAVTGKPVVGMMYGYGAVDAQSGRLNTLGFTSSTSNARGEFRLDGVTPGSYAAFASPAADSEMYSDRAAFTVGDSDVSGLVVKVHVGSSIIGNVIIEGADGQPGAPRLSEVRFGVSSVSLNAAPRNSQVRIAPDGSFRTTGLPRGIASFIIYYPTPKGLALLRVERDGVEQKNGIEVGSGEEISGVRVVFGYGTGAIRGQVKVQDGDIPAAAMMFLNIRRAGTNQPLNMRTPTTPDSRGRFLIDGLLPGEYELSLLFQTRSAPPVAGGPPIISRDVKQIVTVTNGAESQVTMLVDLNSKDR